MKKIIALFIFFWGHFCYAATAEAKLYITDNEETFLGTVTFTDTPYGLLIIPNLNNLPSGKHGFHIHQNANCGRGGMNAGGHFDPGKTNTHLGPYAKGHLGDLPILFVEENGKANTPLLAPRLKTGDIKNLPLMIHSGGDTYSDLPPLGGGGARLGCGIIH